MPEQLQLGTKIHSVNLRRSGDKFTLIIDDDECEGRFTRLSNGMLELIIGDSRHLCYVDKRADERYVFSDGINYLVSRMDKTVRDKQSDEESDTVVLSPITGKLLDLKASNGSKVEKGDVVIVLEAMKMEHRLKAPLDGIVSNLTSIEEGGQVREGELLFEVECE
tara:strand:+ start:98 stop:592 length:495 start_codon:yes stop_codon:yes gene_type:complete